MHSLSGSSAGNHASDATGRLTSGFQDFEADEDVFVTEVVENPGKNGARYLQPQAPPQIVTRLSKQTPVVEDDSDSEMPPVLPEKRRINKHYTTIDHGYLAGVDPAFACYSKPQPQPFNIRCHSPYDNVDENDSILQCWPASGQAAQPQGQSPFMTQSESRVTLVGTGAGANDLEERPPLPPKKKHSLSKYFRKMPGLPPTQV